MNHSLSATRIDHRVALVACESYQAVAEALSEGLSLLGGIEKFCSPGEHLLLKPNLLLGDKPERGSTTHPAFFEATARLLKSSGFHLAYGDSPGFGSPQGAVKASGLHSIAKSLGVELEDFVNDQELAYPDGILLKQFLVAKGVLNVDGVINLPKFKTHALTRLTGAVKNLFGCLPGVQKAGFHARIPDESHFGEMLVDLAQLISPRLHIMDGILGMEGNGPRNGRLRHVGVVLISANPHALDHCVAQMMYLDPALVPTLQAAKLNGYYSPDQVIVLGESLESHIIQDYDVNRARTSTTGPKSFYLDIFKNWVTPRPMIDAESCSHCGRCVTVCPATPKALGFLNGRKEPPQYNYNRCIRCYCCQEMCPDEAISIQTPILGELLNKIKI